MQQTISIEPYQLTIQQAYLFPQTLITAPKSGEYLAVSYTSSGKSSDSSIQRIDDVAWAALKLEQANQYITPLSLGDVTGSDAIWSDLSDMGVDWELHNGFGTAEPLYFRWNRKRRFASVCTERRSSADGL